MDVVKIGRDSLPGSGPVNPGALGIHEYSRRTFCSRSEASVGCVGQVSNHREEEIGDIRIGPPNHSLDFVNIATTRYLQFPSETRLEIHSINSCRFSETRKRV